jgi:hypothetical protein
MTEALNPTPSSAAADVPVSEIAARLLTLHKEHSMHKFALIQRVCADAAKLIDQQAAEIAERDATIERLKQTPVINWDCAPLDEDALSYVAAEISHDMRCEDKPGEGEMRIRWNNRAAGMLLKTIRMVQKERDQLAERLKACEGERDALLKHNQIYAAAIDRWADFGGICDYHSDPTTSPLECPGRIEGTRDYAGGWCHWCQLHGARLGIDDPDSLRGIMGQDRRDQLTAVTKERDSYRRDAALAQSRTKLWARQEAARIYQAELTEMREILAQEQHQRDVYHKEAIRLAAELTTATGLLREARDWLPFDAEVNEFRKTVRDFIAKLPAIEGVERGASDLTSPLREDAPHAVAGEAAATISPDLANFLECEAAAIIPDRREELRGQIKRTEHGDYVDVVLDDQSVRVGKSRSGLLNVWVLIPGGQSFLEINHANAKEDALRAAEDWLIDQALKESETP